MTPIPASDDPKFWRDKYTTAANDLDRTRNRLQSINNYLADARRRASQLATTLQANGITIPAPQDTVNRFHAESIAHDQLIQGTPILLEPGAITVAGWSPDKPGTANATMTEVHAMFAVPELDATFVVTFASPHTISLLIDALTQYRDAVWPGSKL